MNTTFVNLIHQDTSKPRAERTLLFSEVVGWSSVYCLVAIATVINNSLAIAALTTRRILRKRTNYFLICLATADLFVGAISIPLYIAAIVLWWQRGETLNPIQTTFSTTDIFTAHASIFTLTVISLERLCAVAVPIKHRVTSTRTYHVLIGGIWLLAATPSVVYLMQVYIAPFPSSLFFYMMRSATIVSFLVICFAYISIWLKVRSRGQSVNQVRAAAGQERVLLEKAFLLSVIFIATWLPFNVLTFVSRFCSDCADITYQVIFVVKLFHFLNSFINPFVYTFRDLEFRKILLNSLNKLCCKLNP